MARARGLLRPARTQRAAALSPAEQSRALGEWSSLPCAPQTEAPHAPPLVRSRPRSYTLSLRHSRSLPPNPPRATVQVRFVVMETVCALAYCHDQNVLYRDLKPENLLIDDQVRFKEEEREGRPGARTDARRRGVTREECELEWEWCVNRENARRHRPPSCSPYAHAPSRLAALTPQGHIRLIDMGLAARVNKKTPKRRSRVGTDCYMAPEVSNTQPPALRGCPANPPPPPARPCLTAPSCIPPSSPLLLDTPFVPHRPPLPAPPPAPSRSAGPRTGVSPTASRATGTRWACSPTSSLPAPSPLPTPRPTRPSTATTTLPTRSATRSSRRCSTRWDAAGGGEDGDARNGPLRGESPARLHPPTAPAHPWWRRMPRRQSRPSPRVQALRHPHPPSRLRTTARAWAAARPVSRRSSTTRTGGASSGT